MTTRRRYRLNFVDPRFAGYFADEVADGMPAFELWQWYLDSRGQSSTRDDTTALSVLCGTYHRSLVLSTERKGCDVFIDMLHGNRLGDVPIALHRGLDIPIIGPFNVEWGSVAASGNPIIAAVAKEGATLRDVHHMMLRVRQHHGVRTTIPEGWVDAVNLYPTATMHMRIPSIDSPEETWAFLFAPGTSPEAKAPQLGAPIATPTPFNRKLRLRGKP